MPSRRSRDGLIRYAKDITSQNGEDGILERLFELLPNSSTRWCVDVGAWDGQHLSNTHTLLVERQWKGVLIEGDASKFAELSALHTPLHNICLHRMVSGRSPDDPHSLVQILQSVPDLPHDLDFLCIDIDGADYWLLHDLFHHSEFRPQVVCIEFNPTMPDDLIYIPSRVQDRQGASLSALVELAQDHDYVLVNNTVQCLFCPPPPLPSSSPSTSPRHFH